MVELLALQGKYHQAAVQAGLALQINNGQTEGHMTGIKLIKRIICGKAGFALLRQCVSELFKWSVHPRSCVRAGLLSQGL